MEKKIVLSLILLASTAYAAISVDGTLDPFFGSYGQTSIPLTNATVSSVQTVTEKSIGTNNQPALTTKYVIAGSSSSNIALIALLQDGSAQAEFGSEGIAVDTRYVISTATTGTSAGSTVSSIVVDDEIIVAATQDVDGHVLVVPYNASNGRPSTTSAVVDADLGAPAVATGIALLKNTAAEKSMVVTANVGSTPYLVFVENNSYTAVNITFPFDALFNDVKVQQDGKIVVTGLSDEATVTQILTARFLPDGTFDTTFGNGNGYQRTAAGTNSRGSTLTIQGDGKIVVTGRNATNDTVIVRYQADGKIDASFATAGIATFDVTALERVQLAIDNDGKILVNGTVTTGTNAFYSIRYDQSGTPDTSFGSLGIRATTVFNTAVNLGSALVPAPSTQVTNESTIGAVGGGLAEGTAILLVGATEAATAVTAASLVTRPV